eukprot:10490233-Lingulodinium_polyedra.AAC.1
MEPTRDFTVKYLPISGGHLKIYVLECFAVGSKFWIELRDMQALFVQDGSKHKASSKCAPRSAPL